MTQSQHSDSAQSSYNNGAPTPTIFPSPPINGQDTTVSLFSPLSLLPQTLLLSIYNLINTSFATSQFDIFPDTTKVTRLDSPQQFLDQAGQAPGTFTYVVTYAGTEEVVATASAKRFFAPGEQGSGSDRKAFMRTRLPAGGSEDDGAECWELKLMAVDPKAQRQGLGKFLMGLCEEEVRRVADAGGPVYSERGDGAAESEEGPKGHTGSAARKLFMVLTTVKEANYDLYRRRGYADDYETRQPLGFLGSRHGFTIIHMSKLL